MRLATVMTVVFACAGVLPAQAETRIRIMPPDGGVLAAGQRVDVRVEATGDAGPPRGLTVLINGKDVTSLNLLAAGVGGERGAGGTGTDAGAPAAHRAGAAPPGSSNFLLRGFSLTAAGPLRIEARTADGARASVGLNVERWQTPGPAAAAKNVILLLGDGMGIVHRTAARLMSRGLQNGKAAGRLAMDTLDVTGLVMTASLNSAITDSSPGMAAYSTGQKNSNNQEGVFPDNTADPFDNPRIEYLGELLRRTRGRGFGPEVKRRIMLGTYVLSAGYYDAYYRRAMRVRELIRREVRQAFRDVDVILLPTTPTPAWTLGEKRQNPLAMYLSDIFTVPANLAGLPAISLPVGLSEAGLPLAVQLWGDLHADAALLSAALQLEAAIGYDAHTS